MAQKGRISLLFPVDGPRSCSQFLIATLLKATRTNFKSRGLSLPPLESQHYQFSLTITLLP